MTQAQVQKQSRLHERAVAATPDTSYRAEIAASLRIAGLRAALAANEPHALASFWAEVAATGSPLIEPIADDAEYCIATFVWRG